MDFYNTVSKIRERVFPITTKMAAKCRKTPEELKRDMEACKLLVEYATVGNLEGVKKLVNSGVSVNAEQYNRSLFYKSLNYMTPLQCAASKGHSECVKFLIEQNASLDSGDRYDITAVHLAAEQNHLRCLQLLLENGADCNAATKYVRHGYYSVPHAGGTTALHLAAMNNNNACVRELILNGADYNAVDEQGRNSLYIAAKQGYANCVIAHLRNAIGKDILSLPVKDQGETPLHECVKHGLKECVDELLIHGSDVNYRNKHGFSPLHLSLHNTEKYSPEIVRLLITKGYKADINHSDSTGVVPLQYVCFNCNSKQDRRPAEAAFLIAYGAKFENLKNKQGVTILTQELKSVIPDYTVLQAMVDSMSVLPSLESLGVYATNTKVPREKYDWYKSIFSSPRTLQHYCRCVVRSALGAQRLRDVEKLPLPNTLKDFVLLECTDYH